jgi:hypothetical protein
LPPEAFELAFLIVLSRRLMIQSLFCVVAVLSGAASALDYDGTDGELNANSKVEFKSIKSKRFEADPFGSRPGLTLVSVAEYLNNLYEKRSVEDSLNVDDDTPIPHRVVTNLEADMSPKFLARRFDEIRDDVGFGRDNDPTSLEDDPMMHKRLETIDGVEIASSYREYIDLASGDIDDRLVKNHAQLNDLQERIKKRTELNDQIEKEIVRRRAYAQELSEKDKMLRNRLVRNTEMKSALTNLADIAGYKLDTAKLSGLQASRDQGKWLRLTVPSAALNSSCVL